ncbi:MAG: MurT ligase domain-containing protein [bacterium]|nr:MurT ligase domain-containing protein [bacterium]
MRLVFTLLAAKFTDSIIRILSLGSGSTWPGHLALALYPNILKKITQDSDAKIILIAGTNGKTTTSLIIKSILEKSGLNVFHNEEGANLLNGITTAFIRRTSLTGSISGDVAVLEVDENSLPHVLNELIPHGIIFLNLFRDQLDRYGEVDIVAHKWRAVLSLLTKDTTVVVNADDPQLAHISRSTKAPIIPFTIDPSYFSKKEQSHDVDSTYCPECGTKLSYQSYTYSHLGDYACSKCSFTRAESMQDYSHFLSDSHLKGIYNAYNISAAVTLVKSVFTSIDTDIISALKAMKPAFGRQEVIDYKGRKVLMLLSKNPVGFNQSIAVGNDMLKDKKNRVLVCLNDRIPDGRDISWIWDVEFEQLYKEGRDIYVSGDRATSMGVRLQYCTETGNMENIHVYQDLAEAVEASVKDTSTGNTLVVMATYSAMLEVRKILVGRKLL